MKDRTWRVAVHLRDSIVPDEYDDVFNHTYDEDGVHVQLHDNTRIDYPIAVVLKCVSKDDR
jgi:hypothetical protein